MRCLLLLCIAVVACGGRREDVIVVGSKNFTEQRILGELLAQTVESVGLKAERKFDLGGTFVCDAALRAGQIDMYVEYTGTALSAILKEDATGKSPREVYERVKERYAKDGLVWMEPLGFDNTFALVIRGEDSKRLGLRTISDVVPYAKAWRAGFGYEFKERPDGYRRLQNIYNLQFRDVTTLDLGLLYHALIDERVDIVAGNSTDGQIRHHLLAVLRDDRNSFPPYQAAIVVREEQLQSYPALTHVLNRLNSRLSNDTIIALNDAVDGLHKSPASAVHDIVPR